MERICEHSRIRREVLDGHTSRPTTRCHQRTNARGHLDPGIVMDRQSHPANTTTEEKFKTNYHQKYRGFLKTYRHFTTSSYT